MADGDPLLLEQVLLRHKKLRVFVMHAGWPRLESMIALMYAHPQVYVDVAALQFEEAIPRAGYMRYLRSLIEAGFAKRIMFGSDFGFPRAGAAWNRRDPHGRLSDPGTEGRHPVQKRRRVPSTR